MDMDLLDMLEKATEEEILTIITMSLMYYTKKYNRPFNTTLNLIKGGYKELEKAKDNQ